MYSVPTVSKLEALLTERAMRFTPYALVSAANCSDADILVNVLFCWTVERYTMKSGLKQTWSRQ